MISKERVLTSPLYTRLHPLTRDCVSSKRFWSRRKRRTAVPDQGPQRDTRHRERLPVRAPRPQPPRSARAGKRRQSPPSVAERSKKTATHDRPPTGTNERDIVGINLSSTRALTIFVGTVESSCGGVCNKLTRQTRGSGPLVDTVRRFSSDRRAPRFCKVPLSSHGGSKECRTPRPRHQRSIC